MYTYERTPASIEVWGIRLSCDDTPKFVQSIVLRATRLDGKAHLIEFATTDGWCTATTTSEELVMTLVKSALR